MLVTFGDFGQTATLLDQSQDTDKERYYIKDPLGHEKLELLYDPIPDYPKEVAMLNVNSSTDMANSSSLLALKLMPAPN